MHNRLSQRQVLKDWTRVDDFEVANGEFRTFEYHVVALGDAKRTILTIKLYREDDMTIRLDPSDIEPSVNEERYVTLAEKRVRQLFINGTI